MKVLPLASSSKGNAYLVEHGGAVILIDCGVCYRELGRLMKEKSAPEVSPEDLSAVLVTHSHSDHVKGLGVLLKHCDVPVYANVMTAETVVFEQHLDENAFVCFENGQEFAIGPFTVSAFSVPHDTSDPVGYLVRTGEGASERVYFHGTDIGLPLDSIGLKLAEADVATIESNHDPVMLRTSGRPPNLIQRIAGPRGHLSNDQAAELVRRFASPRLRQLFLAHLSHDCNTPQLALGRMRDELAEMSRSDIELALCE